MTTTPTTTVRPLTQQNVSRLLKRHGIPVRKVWPNGNSQPLVTRFSPCSVYIRVWLPGKGDYQRAEVVLSEAGYLFRDVGPDHEGKHRQLAVTGRRIGLDK